MTGAIKWTTTNSKTPYIGYCTNSSDGTFVMSITGTTYSTGLAIGGSSGNLLYNGNRVLDASNYKSYCTPTNIGAASSSHTHSYLPLSGGTVAGNLTVNGTFKANNIITGTKPLTISSASALASISLTSKDLGFTPSVNTSIVATVRKECAPTTLYLNTYTTFYNGTLYVCITNGSSTSTTVPTGTYHIDYIITNNT